MSVLGRLQLSVLSYKLYKLILPACLPTSLALVEQKVKMSSPRRRIETDVMKLMSDYEVTLVNDNMCVVFQ
ncbi:hypothetical protein EYC84_009436 [Monilinia fructicola]|uniref:Uncharacterized protein n=1 Tax=Monilinia fructicola TaxID=38448 RepID=A0A5M9J7V8_MONFR|nr:hypothetical protein EYC84_009436 [Monilinia fructicola]